MDNLFILMIVYLIYMAVSFWVFNFNFLSPTFVFSTSIFLMLFLAYYSANTMGLLFAINFKTFTIFAVAGFIFFATELIFYFFHTVNYFMNKREGVEVKIQPQPLEIDPQVQWAVTLLLAFSLLLAVAVLYLNTGGGGWNSRLMAYRKKLADNPGGVRFWFIVSQLQKLNFAIVNLFGYVFIYNLTVCGVGVKKLISYALDMVLYALFSVAYIGARQLVIELILFLIMIYIALSMRPEGRKRIFSFLVFRAVPILIILVSVFSLSGSLVGRYETRKSGFQNFIEYFSGGLYAFNLHVDDNIPNEIWGQDSFKYIYTIPQNLGLMPRESNRTFKFELYGNTVTIFGRWNKDFGTIGIFVMTSLVSLIYSYLFYKKIVYSRNEFGEHHLGRIFYCQFMIGLVWAGYDDRLGPLLTIQTATFLFLVWYFHRLFIIQKFKIY